jgi:hypothetical protein
MKRSRRQRKTRRRTRRRGGAGHEKFNELLNKLKSMVEELAVKTGFDDLFEIRINMIGAFYKLVMNERWARQRNPNPKLWWGGMLSAAKRLQAAVFGATPESLIVGVDDVIEKLRTLFSETVDHALKDADLTDIIGRLDYINRILDKNLEKRSPQPGEERLGDWESVGKDD